MFKVKHKYNDRIETVYDVRHDRTESEYTSSDRHDDIEFLIYSNDNYKEMYEWVYVDAVYYEPIKE